MGDLPPKPVLERVTLYCDETGPGWEWLEGAPRLRRLEDVFPLRCYLNLAWREDRRSEAEYQFAVQGLAVERMHAVNGRLARNLRRFESPGSYGCALSHRLLLRRTRMERAEAVLVFEDDVILHPEFRRLAESLPLPDDWGILFFGCQHLELPVPVSPGIVRVTRAYSTHAFAVRGNYAARVQAMMTQRREPGTRRACDVKLADLAGEIPTYAVWPNLARQATIVSDITGKTLKYYREDGLQEKNRQHIKGIPRRMWHLAAAAAQDRRQTGDAEAPLIMELTGGTGNHLFQWAFGRVLSAATGRPLRCTLGRPQHPGSVQPDAVGIPLNWQEPDWKADVIDWPGDCPPDFLHQAVQLLNRQPDRAVMLRGYWQNPALWQGCEEIIRSEIKIPPVSLISTIPEGRTPVCVQVRRGDYLKTSLHNVCGAGYYRLGMAEMRRRVREPVFIVVSEDTEWCREQLAAPDVIIHGAHSFLEDYGIMLRCRAFIIANSTFGWWPAWLSGSRDVICPEPWLNGKEWQIVPPHWTRLAVTEPREEAT